MLRTSKRLTAAHDPGGGFDAVCRGRAGDWAGPTNSGGVLGFWWKQLAGSARLPGMKSAFTAVLKRDEGWWIGWIEEVPGVNCQAKTRPALIRSLRLTLKEALAMNREEALALAGHDHETALIEM
jgi:hypothetical protein